METTPQNDFYKKHNRKIAKLRGDDWKTKLREAKRDSRFNELTAIAQARYDMGLTQMQVSKMLGFNNNTVYSRIERGSVATSSAYANKIAKTLGKKVDDLFYEFEPNKYLAI